MASFQAFVSHNKADKSVAREIAIFLAAEDVGVWFDEWEVMAGDSIIQQLNDGLIGCTHFVIVWSANSARSEWVRRELAAALMRGVSSGTPRVIPVLLDDTPLPPLLSDIRGVRFENDSEEARAELIRGVIGKEPTDSLTRAVVRKYHELTTDSEGPLGYRACPTCGGASLRPSMLTDYRQDEVYYFIECTECGWSDWSQ